ncbi:MAG: hypothetical protein Q3972_06950 [Corynebacterium sp.]|nr:hypothetical protein [Corynebacterium sp.]
MIILASVVAIICLIAAVILLRMDQANKQAAMQATPSVEDDAPESLPENIAEQEPEEVAIIPTRTCDPIPVKVDVDVEEEFADIPLAEPEDPYFDNQEWTSITGNIPVVDDEVDEVEEESYEETYVEDEDIDEVADEVVDEVEETPATSHRSPSMALLNLPGMGKRRRKAWAESYGFEYLKEDRDLMDEWLFGPAASGAPIVNVVQGSAEDYEMILADVNNTTVMAMRRETPSGEVLRLTRAGLVADSESFNENFGVELMNVGAIPAEAPTFEIATTDSMAARVIMPGDSRLVDVVEELPQAVSMVWAEGPWVLATFSEKSTIEDWENTWLPLARFADVAHVLPPRAARRVEKPLETRPMPVPMTVPEAEEELSTFESDTSRPQVMRPAYPVEFPTRAQSLNLGGETLLDSDLGGDVVDSIADDLAASRAGDNDGRRIVRTQPDDSPIFQDSEPHDEPPAPPEGVMDLNQHR